MTVVNINDLCFFYLWFSKNVSIKIDGRSHGIAIIICFILFNEKDFKW